jgi:hypothetical protein
MGEHTTLFERAASRYTEPELSKDGLLLRRHRKLRNQRVAAGVLGTAVFAFVAIGFVWLLGSEGGPVVVPASPSPTREFATFSSALHRITIDYPADWKVRPATEPWGSGRLSFDASDVDVIYDPTRGDDLYLALVSKPLGRLSGEDWVDDMFDTPWICKGTTGAGSGDIYPPDVGRYANGVQCSGGGRTSASGHYLRVATDTRAYLIYAHVADEPALTLALEETYEDFFQRIVLTVELEYRDPNGSSS